MPEPAGDELTLKEEIVEVTTARESGEIVEVVGEDITIELVEEHDHHVRITVNSQFVEISSDEATGLQIKEAAIRAGVPIQVDFVLSEVRPNGEQKVIRDERKVHLKDGDEFWAIPGDDNS
jgi:hypothetical protein